MNEPVCLREVSLEGWFVTTCGAPVPRDVCPFAHPGCPYAKEEPHLVEHEVKTKSARQRLFSALRDLDEEVGEVANAGSRNLRKQAVVDVVNALYPKTEKK